MFFKWTSLPFTSLSTRKTLASESARVLGLLFYYYYYDFFFFCPRDERFQKRDKFWSWSHKNGTAWYLKKLLIPIPWLVIPDPETVIPDPTRWSLISPPWSLIPHTSLWPWLLHFLQLGNEKIPMGNYASCSPPVARPVSHVTFPLCVIGSVQFKAARLSAPNLNELVFHTWMFKVCREKNPSRRDKSVIFPLVCTKGSSYNDSWGT